MLKIANIDGNKVMYEDKEFTYEQSHLKYIGYGRNIKNPKGNTSCSHMFSKCTSLINLDLSQFDTSNIWSMASMFKNCYVLKELDISNFNISKVKEMSEMFYNCKSLKILDLSEFNFKEDISCRNMFNGCNCVVYVKDEQIAELLTRKTRYSNIRVKDFKTIYTYEVSKIGVQSFRRISSETPQGAICKIFGITENQLEIVKTDEQHANICVRGVGNKRNNTNYYYIKIRK